MSNSKKNNHQSESAVSGGDVLQRFQVYADVLRESGASISGALASERQLRRELGEAEITGTGDPDELRRRLATTVSEREASARRRASAVEALLAMSAELREARASVSASLTEIAMSVVADFNGRWSRACQELGRLHGEAAALSRALRTTVSAPPPYIATLSADGTRMNVVFSGHLAADAVRLPPQVTAITTHVDELDAAMSLCAAVAQSRQWDERYIALQRSRSGNMPVMTGTYSVIRDFDHMGARFEVGMLVSGDVMGPGTLHRRWQARELMPVEGAATAAA